MSHFYNEAGELVEPYSKGSYPSVTTIQDIASSGSLEDTISRLGADKFIEVMELARNRGTEVHRACDDHNRGVIMIDLSPEAEPYFQGYLNWLEAVSPKIIHSELFLTSKKYKYSGTADLICDIDGQLWLIDIKTTSMHKKEHGIQLKAYQQAYYEMYGVRAKMAVLRLTDKTQKGWQWKVYAEPLTPFLGLLNYFKWTVRKRKPVKQIVEFDTTDLPTVEWKVESIVIN